MIQASNILIYEQSVAEQEDKFYIVTWLALSRMSQTNWVAKKTDISWEMSQILRKLRLFNYTLNFKGQISSKIYGQFVLALK